jgi:hypothetical protein
MATTRDQVTSPPTDEELFATGGVPFFGNDVDIRYVNRLRELLGLQGGDSLSVGVMRLAVLRDQVERVRSTGPGALLQRLCERFDALLSLDHRAARQASETYDEAFHSAVHALKDLRVFAGIIAPKWREAAEDAARGDRQADGQR